MASFPGVWAVDRRCRGWRLGLLIERVDELGTGWDRLELSYCYPSGRKRISCCGLLRGALGTENRTSLAHSGEMKVHDQLLTSQGCSADGA